MFTAEILCSGIDATPLSSLYSDLLGRTRQTFSERRHGDVQQWQDVLETLPAIRPSRIDLNEARITVGTMHDCSESDRVRLKQKLMQLHPWRKGPFNLYGVHIDSEWRSDLKWSRVVAGIDSLEGKTILDIGCGNGYYLLRMLGAGASCVLGVDPTQLYVAQFCAMRHYLPACHGFVLPLKSEELPFKTIRQAMGGFDVVFSMGVLYHRRQAEQHLQEIKHCLKRGGQLVLETLVLDGQDERELIPQGRYAKMRNVWSIPTVSKLQKTLVRAGFAEISIIDISHTSVDEQRKTEWMPFQSLSDFLNPMEPSQTVEGYPAPLRAILCCRVD